MTVNLEGRVAIVTGAGGGLGREHALLLARLGAKVVVNDPGGSVAGTGDDRRVAQMVVDEIRAAGGEAVANLDSVAEFSAAQRIVQTAMDTYGRLDILVNNAGILRDKTFAKMEVEDFELVLKVHLMGTVYCTKAAWPIMNEQGYGRIVLTTSAAGIVGGFGQSNYGAAKMGTLGLMNCLALEGARNGVLVNAISPAAATRMTQALIPPQIGQHLRPDLVSPAVAWLASEACTQSGLVVNAVAGYFACQRFVEGEGVQFNPTEPVTADMVADAAKSFGQMNNARAVDPRPLGDLEARLQALGLS
ncbi:SDR family NAD(P)-dependent oxidoreductase [Hydrogenophaga sp. YM1]|uniref:SDR family NAD(P)-dependent oxidoreductase n=1 Tax=Hydrogenophaga sp. YM1 TaxID=2806262 RepID=UPI00195ED9CD|nr:SDR family NAD(P)-dependent oxidoreductase [Hydrogenophaga sp. YM1]QRR33999.1 SDR family NAD(P)-dependent oxidoreductase [Hydrogenophaga sp. YM1]